MVKYLNANQENEVPIAIFDIDGTLANITHRLHHIKNGNRDWKSFNTNVHNDAPISNILGLMETLRQSSNYTILLVSGRGEEIRKPTEQWLNTHKALYEKLYMRPAGDYRKDTILKCEILEQIRIAYPNIPIAFVVDDRTSVVKMWRDQGLICLQCAEWDEENTTTFKPAQRGTLTLMVGPSGAGKSTWLIKQVAIENCGKEARKAINESKFREDFPDLGISKDSIISSDDLRHQLTGNFQDQSKNPQVFSALFALAKARIDNGLPAVIDATNIKRADRLAIINHTKPTNIRYIVINRPLEEKYETQGWRNPTTLGFDLIAKHHSTFTSQLKDILAGDNLSNVEVIDLRK